MIKRNYHRLTEEISKKVKKFKQKYELQSVNYEQVREDLYYVETIGAKTGLLRTWASTPKEAFKRLRKVLKNDNKE